MKHKICATVGPEMKICCNSQKSKAAINTGLNLFRNPLTKPIKLIISSGLTQVQILTQKNVTALCKYDLRAVTGNKEGEHRVLD